jgi:hypothetical protein
MLAYIILACISFVVAAFGSMVGVGGGFLLMPVLLMMYPNETPERLTFISLFAVLVNAATAFVGYARLRRVDYKSGLIMGLCTVPTAVLARIIQGNVSTGTFRPIFGSLLIAIGIYILWRIRGVSGPHGHRQVDPKPGWLRRELTDKDGTEFSWAYDTRIAVAAGLIGGFVGAFFGIGGGILQMPIMTQMLSFPPHVAAATTIMVLTMNTLAGISTDLVRQFHSVPFALAGAAGIGSLFGAQVGTRLSKRISGKGILYLLAAALLVAGGRLVIYRGQTTNAAIEPPSAAQPASQSTTPTENPETR